MVNTILMLTRNIVFHKSFTGESSRNEIQSEFLIKKEHYYDKTTAYRTIRHS